MTKKATGILLDELEACPVCRQDISNFIEVEDTKSSENTDISTELSYVATQDEVLRKRLKIETAAKRVENYLRVSTEELKTFAKITGHDDVHDLNIDDLCTVNSEISDFTDIRHV